MLKKRFETHHLNINPLWLYFIFYRNQRDKKRNFKYLKYLFNFLFYINKALRGVFARYRYLYLTIKFKRSALPSNRSLPSAISRAKFLDESQYQTLSLENYFFKGMPIQNLVTSRPTKGKVVGYYPTFSVKLRTTTTTLFDGINSRTGAYSGLLMLLLATILIYLMTLNRAVSTLFRALP